MGFIIIIGSLCAIELIGHLPELGNCTELRLAVKMVTAVASLEYADIKRQIIDLLPAPYVVG
jgi:hypothetical protein